MRVKIEDVAREADVSTATVSLALNGSDKVNAQTRVRVNAVAKRMGYRPNPSAKRLAMRKSRQIGLVIPDIENQYYAGLTQYILNELQAGDYALSISSSMNSRQMERRIVSDMIDNQVEGLLIAPVEKPNENVEYLDLLNAAGIPFLFVTASYPNLNHPCVMCDLYDGMYRLLDSLYARGYSRFAMLSGAQNVHCFDLRDRAFLDYMRARGLKSGAIHHLDGVRYDHAYQFARNMDAEGLDAVVCVNDMMALGVINALIERGLSIPEDIAVAGFDDSIFSRVSSISITTVRQDIHQMAVQAAERIISLAQGEAPARQEPPLIPCEVILRRSTGSRAALR